MSYHCTTRQYFGIVVVGITVFHDLCAFLCYRPLAHEALEQFNPKACLRGLGSRASECRLRVPLDPSAPKPLLAIRSLAEGLVAYLGANANGTNSFVCRFEVSQAPQALHRKLFVSRARVFERHGPLPKVWNPGHCSLERAGECLWPMACGFKSCALTKPRSPKPKACTPQTRSCSRQEQPALNLSLHFRTVGLPLLAT